MGKMLDVKLLSCFLLVAVAAVVINAHTAGSRHLLQEDEQSGAEAFWDDAKNGVTGAWAKFWGGSCATNDQCADVVATCSASHNECRPVWWFWLIIASIVVSLVLSLICCICCGICSCIADCLCCCCR